MTTDKTKWSYLAGILDGEGTVSITRRLRTDVAKNAAKAADSGYSNANPSLAYCMRVSVYNTNIALMQWLIENFGGVYYTKSRSIQNVEKHKVEYDWRIKGAKNHERILLGILPYLVIKKEQAKLALEYVRITMERNWKDSQEKREPLAIRCMELNRRGPAPETNTKDARTENVQAKIESELDSDIESAPDVNQGLENIPLLGGKSPADYMYPNLA